MNIAIIPARGGSKRIPKKNIKYFSGKPIIAWSIEVAIKSGIFDRVIVSTDDEQIAEVATTYGAEVPFMRPSDLSDDHTGTNLVVKQTVEWLLTQGCSIEYICCIYATAPLLQLGYLKEGYNKILISDVSFVFSVTTFPAPVQRSIRIDEKGLISPIWSEYTDSRSQDLDEAYHDAGQFYWGTVEAFLHQPDVFSSRALPVILPRYCVQDIDTYEDWRRAEIIHKMMVESGELVLV